MEIMKGYKINKRITRLENILKIHTNTFDKLLDHLIEQEELSAGKRKPPAKRMGPMSIKEWKRTNEKKNSE